MHQKVEEYLGEVNLAQCVGVFSLLIISFGVLTGTLTIDFSRSRAAGILYTQTFENGITTPGLAFNPYCANATTFARTSLSPKVGNYSFKFSGTDDCAGNNSFVYYKIADAKIPITRNTVLEYKIVAQIAAQSTLGKNVGVDLLLDNGQYLRNQDIYSDDKVTMHPAHQSNHVAISATTFTTVRAHIGKLKGRTITQIIVGYDDSSSSQTGSFDARIDDIKIYEDTTVRKIILGNRVESNSGRQIVQNLTIGSLVSATKQPATTVGVAIDGPVVTNFYFQNTSGVDIPGSNIWWKVDFLSGATPGASDTNFVDGWIRQDHLVDNSSSLSQISQAVTALPITCTAPNPVKGDVNCDGVVGVTDGVVALQCATGVAPCNNPAIIDPDIYRKLDMDCNEQITVTDGVNVLRKAAGLSVSECTATFPQDTALTCNTERSAALPVTDFWTISGTNVGARLGVNRNFGGIGVELALINKNLPESAVNVIESRSGAGAGWQTSYWAHDIASNRLVVINQAAGNSAGMQWGVHNSFLGTKASSWNLLSSDHYYPSGAFDNSKIATSPCNNTSYAFDYGKPAFDLSLRATPAGTAIQINNQYALRAKVAQNFSEWALEQAFYLDRQVAFDHNLRVYLHGRSGWSEGPILPWKDFTVAHGSGSCNASVCEYIVSTDIAYGVFVWNINGRDIGVAVPANAAGGFILGVDKLPYCGDSTNLRCGNIALHNFLNVQRSAYNVNANEERMYGVNYTIGTIDELKALGYAISQ